MKKGTILVAGLVFFGISTNAQQWNGSAGSTGDINRSGEVGLGTTTPDAPLHIVNGNNTLYRGIGVGQILRGVLGVSAAALVFEEDANSNSSAITQWGDNLYFYRKSGSGIFSGSDLKMMIDPNGSVGIGTTGSFAYSSLTGARLGTTLPPSTGTVRLEVNGVTRSLANIVTSDRSMKINIKSIPNSLEIIKNLEGKTYQWNDKTQREKGADNGLHIGFIAQDIQRVIPEIVIADKDGELGVNYTEIIPILTEAIKEQQGQIEELKNLVNSLRNDAGKMESISKINVALSENNIIVLGQNTPNPFSDLTTIGFNIPSEIKSAKIIFTTTDGKALKSMDISQRGKGVINVYASDLKSGVYIYTLIADGKVIESKRMEVLK